MIKRGLETGGTGILEKEKPFAGRQVVWKSDSLRRQ